MARLSGGLAVSIVVPGRGEGAGCSLCEKLVEMILKEVELDEMSEGGGIQCGALCFGFGNLCLWGCMLSTMLAPGLALHGQQGYFNRCVDWVRFPRA